MYFDIKRKQATRLPLVQKERGVNIRRLPSNNLVNESIKETIIVKNKDKVTKQYNPTTTIKQQQRQQQQQHVTEKITK